jgi:2-dehydro-3-deoxy-D-arabinonate dehydratase
MTDNLLLIRFFLPDKGIRLGCQIGEDVYDISEHFASVSEWLKHSLGYLSDSITSLKALCESLTTTDTYRADQLLNSPDSGRAHYLAPVDQQDVWAAGVTYERSREARQEEAVDGGDVYARVYRADRPELFFKAQGKKVVGNLDYVGIRADATWSVPEPELGIVLNGMMEVVGFTIGNDMSSRDIEGENPLYLPQAKVYTASCALGPGILLMPTDQWLDTTIRIQIERGGKVGFEGSVSTQKIKRTIPELINYLGRSNTYPDGVVLLTGTGVVPPSDFMLVANDVITITIDGIGTLKNTVKVV